MKRAALKIKIGRDKREFVCFLVENNKVVDKKWGADFEKKDPPLIQQKKVVDAMEVLRVALEKVLCQRFENNSNEDIFQAVRRSEISIRIYE